MPCPSDNRDQARALIWDARSDAEDPEQTTPSVGRRTGVGRRRHAGAAGLIAAAAALSVAAWLTIGAGLTSAPQRARPGLAMSKADGKAAHYHAVSNSSHAHNSSTKGKAQHVHNSSKDKAHHARNSSKDKAHGSTSHHPNKTKQLHEAVAKPTSVTTTSTVAIAVEHSDNVFGAVTHWEGWGVVFPWIITSTTTSTTTTTTTTTTKTTTYTGTTTVTTTSTTRTTTTTSTNTSTTTTTSTTTPCAPVEDGDKCYVEIMKTLHGVRITPDAYGSLSRWSTFEEVQAYLHMAGFPDCTMPCECKTADVGDDCYTSVMWVYWHGLEEHPEWYGDLSKDSGFEAVQAHVQKDGYCPTPCRPQYTDERTSMFCFSIIRPSGYEREIAEFQHKMGVGIFGCDGNALLSSENFTVGEGDASMRTIPFHPAKVGVSKDGTAANTLLFLHAWTVVRDKTAALEHDWVIKADPDAVLVPDRIQKHLAPHTGTKSFVRNCNKEPDSPNFPMMFGSLEVLSKAAVKAFFEGGEQECRKSLDWRTWGEDLFLGKCMHHLQVSAIDNFNIISDGVCTEVNCDDAVAGAFHPMKDVDKWSQCWRQATRDGKLSLQPLPAAALPASALS